MKGGLLRGYLRVTAGIYKVLGVILTQANLERHITEMLKDGSL